MTAAWWSLAIFAVQAAFLTGYALNRKPDSEAQSLAVSMLLFSIFCMLGFGILLIRYYQAI